MLLILSSVCGLLGAPAAQLTVAPGENLQDALDLAADRKVARTRPPTRPPTNTRDSSEIYCRLLHQLVLDTTSLPRCPRKPFSPGRCTLARHRTPAH